MKREDNSQKKNKGLSLIEVLIVVAIISLMVSVMGLSVSLAKSRDAEKCARTINSAMESARMMAMSQKGEFTMTVDMEKNTLRIVGTELGEMQNENLQSRVKIYIAGDEGKKSLTVIFDKSTGKVKTLTANGAEVHDLIRITAENPNGKKATVVLVKATGKHYVEYG